MMLKVDGLNQVVHEVVIEHEEELLRECALLSDNSDNEAGGA
jgi:hypothetical protein